MPRIALFGAAPDTMNMGVSALFASTLSALQKEIPEMEFVVFDGGLGKRKQVFDVSDNQTITCTMYGARAGYRWYRPENLAAMSVCAGLGRVGALINPAIKLLDTCDAVLDVSGGDSFSDIYGAKRFLSVIRPKIVALKRNIPLVLLPQTYGPYHDVSRSQRASEVVRKSTMAWARDVHSFEILKDLLGECFDEEKHRCGVDLAFGLSPRPASDRLDEKVADWLEGGRQDTPVVGFNINGLIYNDPTKARNHYGFQADYRAAVLRFLTWILENSNSRIVLVPHVMPPPGNYESDLAASQDIHEQLPDAFRDRVKISPRELDQCQVKWVISKMDWFCGTRMHSTIAALSSCVPTATISYSDKAKGVFESCGQGAHVWDPRTMGTGEIVDGLIESFSKRRDVRTELQKHVPPVKEAAEQQMKAIAEVIRKAIAAGRTKRN